MREFRIIEGTISALQRSNHVTSHASTSSNSRSTSTTHIAMFQLGEERVISNSAEFFPFADDDLVKVVGGTENGQFHLWACKNMTTGWISPESKLNPAIGCFLAFFFFILTGMTLISGGLLLPVTGLMAFFVIKHIKKSKENIDDAKRARVLLLQ